MERTLVSFLYGEDGKFLFNHFYPAYSHIPRKGETMEIPQYLLPDWLNVHGDNRMFFRVLEIDHIFTMPPEYKQFSVSPEVKIEITLTNL